MDLQDKTISCRDCGLDFVFTAGEQGFYIEKGLQNEPQRCPSCRATRRRDRSSTTPRQMTIVACASCGGEAMVPFVPRNDRPVYCTSCFNEMRTGAMAAAH